MMSVTADGQHKYYPCISVHYLLLGSFSYFGENESYAESALAIIVQPNWDEHITTHKYKNTKHNI